MANIKIVLDHPIFDGLPLSFKAPCNCTEVSGLSLQYIDGEDPVTSAFAFADAHGNVLKGIGNLFAAGAMVRVILDVSANKAYIQNADTNAYLEGRFKAIDGRKINGKELRGDIELSAEDVGARPNTWLPTAEEIGALTSDKIPTAEQIGARPADWMPTAEEVGARPADWMPTAEEVGARPNTWLPTAEEIGMPFKESDAHPGCFYRTVDGAVEWLNPPMLPNTEYRTTKRHMGKVVYSKFLELGTLPKKNEKEITHSETSVSQVVSLYTFGKHKTSSNTIFFPYITASGTTGVTMLATATRIIINSFIDGSGEYDGFATIEYTKD